MSAYLRVVMAAAAGGATAVLVDVVGDVLWTAGALGIAEELTAAGDTVLTTSFADDDAFRAAVAALAALPVAADLAVERVHDDESWWDTWRTHAAPVWVGGDRVVVVPAWLPAPPVGEGTVVVSVEPGRSFGSGAHATTRLVLDLLVGLPLAGASVLDVGCGSGVLSVVAARLGAAQVVGVDVDPAAVAATAGNAAANGVEDRVRATAAPLDDLDGTFDVIVANVLLATLTDLAPGIDRRGGGLLAVSGFLAPDAHRARDLFPRWTPVVTATLDGWGAALLSLDQTLAKPN